ncbi:pumilio homolog 12-like [Primulina huaijiensis]|uniref:pumilio homolog 12-like n=1 Tax=Primulina huaijiensis TaxID=1492673 RepID=UPI003CC7798A
MNKFYFLEDFKGKVFWKAMDYGSSSFLCEVLERRKPKDIRMIFSEVKDQICMLMFDGYSSSVIIKLAKVCDGQQMNQLVSSVTANVNLLKALCLHPQGSESMQKFLPCLRTPEQITRMISVFSSLTVPFLKDEFGSGVIDYCFHVFPTEETQPIDDVITDNFLEIATNENGSYLLKVFYSKGFLLECRPRILSEIISNAHHLSHDRFGSHVLVFLIASSKMRDLVGGGIVARLTGAFASLSINRYASSVVLELMKQYKEEYIPQIVNEIISSPDFSRVLRDPYGKRVLKYAKKYSTETICEILNHQISLHSDHMHYA